MKNCRVERQCLVLGDFRLPDAEKVINIVFLYVQNSALYDEVDPPHLPPELNFFGVNFWTYKFKKNGETAHVPHFFFSLVPPPWLRLWPWPRRFFLVWSFIPNSLYFIRLKKGLKHSSEHPQLDTTRVLFLGMPVKAQRHFVAKCHRQKMQICQQGSSDKRYQRHRIET